MAHAPPAESKPFRATGRLPARPAMFSVSAPAKIVFLDRATLSSQTGLKPFPFPHVVQTFDRTAAHEVAARIRDADIVVTNKVRLDAAALA
ncbi:glycerate dehydrogenase, partial [Burkholderia cenocepacia]